MNKSKIQKDVYHLANLKAPYTSGTSWVFATDVAWVGDSSESVGNFLGHNDDGTNGFQDAVHSVLNFKITDLTKRVSNLESGTSVTSAQINNLNSEEFQLKNPISILIEDCENEYIASFPDLELYGEGQTVVQAINELKNEIIELYEHYLETPENKLGKYPIIWKRLLNKLIEK